jgi:hypothetical protein
MKNHIDACLEEYLAKYDNWLNENCIKRKHVVSVVSDS